MGNWEVAGQLLERIDTPVNIVMREAEHEQIKALLDKVMVNRDIRVIPQKEDYSHLFLIDEALKKNEFVVLHGDRYTEGANTVSLSFMGKQPDFLQDHFTWPAKGECPSLLYIHSRKGKSIITFTPLPPRYIPILPRSKHERMRFSRW